MNTRTENTPGPGRNGAIWEFLALVAITTALVLFVLLVISIFACGWGQALTVAQVEDRLQQGMTTKEAEFALGLRPGALSRSSRPAPGGGVFADISRSGWMAVWVVPQHQITLRFDGAGRLTSCSAEIHWHASEEQTPCRLQPAARPAVATGQ